MPSDARLVPPQACFKASFLAALAEFQQQDGSHQNDDLAWIEANFDTFLDDLRYRETNPTVGRVPEVVLWLVEADQFIGRASVRLALNDSLRQIGGHIGYEIRPSMRQQGYGRLICKLALEHARTRGITRALITCDANNAASRKVIQANGGQFDRAVSLPHYRAVVLHFYVPLATDQTVG